MEANSDGSEVMSSSIAYTTMMHSMFQHQQPEAVELSESGSDRTALDDTPLVSMLESGEWSACLTRITQFPAETRVRGEQGRLPLHVACDNDAPAVVIQNLLKTYPESSLMVGTSQMNALLVTCSSHHASQHVVRVLLDGDNPRAQCRARDVDGDTPLHTACRCGAPRTVLELLVRTHPTAVHERDHEGLTPLLRLWVRYTVILGTDAIESVQCATDLQGQLLEAWNKTVLLLRTAHQGVLHPDSSSRLFQVLHAACVVDCPRFIIKVAAKVYPNQLNEKDEHGRTPLLIAAQAPVYKVRDLSDDGFGAEDVVYGDESSRWEDNTDTTDGLQAEPSVIELLLQANQDSASAAACVPDPLGRLPLHVALTAGKRWGDGIKQLIDIFPEALCSADDTSKLLPFMLAAEGWNGDLGTSFEMLRRNPNLLDVH